MSHPDFLTFCRTTRPRTIILLYHWDCDGLASAAIVQQALATLPWRGTLHLRHPQINYYFLTEQELHAMHALAPDVIVTVDLNFSEDVIVALEQITRHVFVFDHHEQTATLQRSGIQDPSVPGCSFLLASAFKQPMTLTAILGMIGDQEDRLASTFPSFFATAEKVFTSENCSFDTALRITKRIDMLSMVGDDDALQHGIALLRDDPRRALTDPLLDEKERLLSDELTRWSNAPLVEEISGILTCRIKSRYHILSEITRRRAQQYPKHILVIDQHVGDFTNLYVRTRRPQIDLSFLVDFARKRGYNAGGKKEVVGMFVPAAAFSTFHKEVLNLLAKNIS